MNKAHNIKYINIKNIYIIISILSLPSFIKKKRNNIMKYITSYTRDYLT